MKARYKEIISKHEPHLVHKPHWIEPRLHKYHKDFRLLWHKKLRRYLIYKKIGYIPWMKDESDDFNLELKKLIGKYALCLACEHFLTHKYMEPGGWALKKIRRSMFKKVNKMEDARQIVERQGEKHPEEIRKEKELANIYDYMQRDADKAKFEKVSTFLGFKGRVSTPSRRKAKKIVFVDSKTGKVLGYRENGRFIKHIS